MIAELSQEIVRALVQNAIQKIIRMNTESRHRDYMVPQHLLVQMLRGENVLEEMDLPEGAEVISMHHDWQRDCLYFRVAHHSFEVVPPGSIPRVVNAKARAQIVDDCGPELFVPHKGGTIVPTMPGTGFAPR